MRNLTNTPGVAERNPSWSPDGKQIAYFSDESGEYALHVRAQNGMGDVRKIGLGAQPTFYYDPTWSPDSKKIAYEDSQRQLWYVDVDVDQKDQKKPQPVRIDRDTYFTPQRGLHPDWSPDSKWIAYTKILKNHLRAVFVYSLDDRQPHQASDGMSDAQFAKFDKSGKYLYFTASTNVGLTTAWLDMSGDERPTSSNVYVTVLRKEDASPLAPESDEEKSADKESKNSEARIQNSEFRIDLQGIDQRILALPIPARDYISLDAGKTGMLFLTEKCEILRRRRGTRNRHALQIRVQDA